MATNSRRRYNDLVDQVDEEIGRRFRDFVLLTASTVSLAALEEHIRGRDVEAVLRDLTINQAALSQTIEAVRSAYMAGGNFEAPAARIMFDMRSPAAERWLRNHSSTFVTRIAESQREAIRVTLTSGVELGRSPRQTALDIVGRINRATGRREGGIVGLTQHQAEFVANARRDLLSIHRPRERIFDPVSGRSRFVGTDHANSYFARTRRDRRFDILIRRHIESGKPMSGADVDRIVGRYADRLLVTRGNNIARTEAIEALNAGRDQAVAQAIHEGVIRSDLMLGTWVHSGEPNPRDAHVAMHGQERRQGEPFESPTGARLMYPGDTSLGAGPEDVANCRCFRRMEYDFIGDAARRARG